MTRLKSHSFGEIAKLLCAFFHCPKRGHSVFVPAHFDLTEVVSARLLYWVGTVLILYWVLVLVSTDVSCWD